MKFDVVIGNPPYNKGMDLDFVDLGYKISNKYTVMITPAKWQTTADDYSGCASKNINYKQFRGNVCTTHELCLLLSTKHGGI